MLLAFSRDLRVVMLRLASRLQTLRYFAASKGDPASAGQRVAACVCPAGQPPGHLADQVGDGGPGVPFPGARHLQADRPLLDEKRIEREAMSSRCAS
jgi:GTP pyrophosphokinase